MDRHPHSPSRLGDDAQPPLVTQGRENDSAGTNRSVYSRYSLAARDPEVHGDAESIAEQELVRACGRWALVQDSSFVAMRSLERALLCGMSSYRQRREHPVPDRSWRRSAEPLRPATGEGERRWVDDRLADLAEAYIRTFLHSRQGHYLIARDLLGEASQHTIRRAWMDCLGHDRRKHDVTTRDAASIVSHAIFHGIPSGEKLRRSAEEKVYAATRVHHDQTAPSHQNEEMMSKTTEWVAEAGRSEGLRRRDEVILAQYEHDQAAHGLMPLDSLLRLMDEEEARA